MSILYPLNNSPPAKPGGIEGITSRSGNRLTLVGITVGVTVGLEVARLWVYTYPLFVSPWAATRREPLELQATCVHVAVPELICCHETPLSSERYRYPPETEPTNTEKSEEEATEVQYRRPEPVWFAQVRPKVLEVRQKLLYAQAAMEAPVLETVGMVQAWLELFLRDTQVLPVSQEV